MSNLLISASSKSPQQAGALLDEFLVTEAIVVRRALDEMSGTKKQLFDYISQDIAHTLEPLVGSHVTQMNVPLMDVLGDMQSLAGSNLTAPTSDVCARIDSFLTSTTRAAQLE